MMKGLPPRHPPLPPSAPMRISLNLDDLPIPCPQHNQVFEECLINDSILHCSMLKRRFQSTDMLQSNFASAFTSQSEFYEDETPVAIPNIKVAPNSQSMKRTNKLFRPNFRGTKDREGKATRLLPFK